MWKKFIRNYFTFNRRERNGLIVLILIMGLIAYWPHIYRKIYRQPEVDFSAFQQAIDSFKAYQTQPVNINDSDNEPLSIASLEQPGPARSGDAAAGSSLFPFDPNVLDEDGWKQLGIPDRTVKTIRNYLAKGGKFNKKEDLMKIYGFRESDYSKLEPYIEFNSLPAASAFDHITTEKSNSAAAPKGLLELNTADSLQLVSLSGIGPVLSSRIIKYRSKLGGFVSTEQLKEIYGLQESTYEMIKDELTVNAALIQKLNVNTVTLPELKNHPYFRYPVASMIVSYREQHGSFAAPEDLRNVDAVTDSVFQKIIPYLSF